MLSLPMLYIINRYPLEIFIDYYTTMILKMKLYFQLTITQLLWLSTSLQTTLHLMVPNRDLYQISMICIYIYILLPTNITLLIVVLMVEYVLPMSVLLRKLDVLLVFRVYTIMKSLISLLLLMALFYIPYVGLSLLLCVNMFVLIMDKLFIPLDSLTFQL